MADGSELLTDREELLRKFGVPKCPHCDGCEPYHITTRDRFKCRKTQKQFSRKTASKKYRASKLPFEKLRAIEVDFKKGLYASQVATKYGVEYHTAHRLCQVFGGLNGWYAARPVRYRPYDQVYPYGRRENVLVAVVDRLTPQYRNADLRSDLCQEILLIALAQSLTPTDIAEAFSVLLKRAWRGVADPMRPISIYTPVFENGGATMVDFIDADGQYLRGR